MGGTKKLTQKGIIGVAHQDREKQLLQLVTSKDGAKIYEGKEEEMIIHNRHISSSETRTRDFPNSQASLNSNGCLTLRKYNRDNRTEDEIIVFNEEETRAIASLFVKMKDIANVASGLPF